MQMEALTKDICKKHKKKEIKLFYIEFRSEAAEPFDIIS